MPDRNPLTAFPFGFFTINPATSWARFFNPQVFSSFGEVDRILAGLESMSRSGPATHRALTQRLRGALDDHAAAEADT